MKDPLISIITPSYNQVAFIEYTIRSVLRQDYPRIEYIVIDGLSDDGSVDVISKYDSQIAYWVSEQDEGQSHAIQKGIEISKGEIICWINSDDLFFPGAIRKVVSHFKNNPQVEWLIGGACVIDRYNTIVKTGFGALTLGVRPSFKRLLYYHMDGIFQPAVFWKRRLYDKVGGIDPSLQFIMDRDLFIRFSREGKYGLLPEVVSAFRSYAENKSNTIQHIREKECDLIAKKYASTNTPYPLRRMLYYRYRLPSLCRKISLKYRQNKILDDLDVKWIE